MDATAASSYIDVDSWGGSSWSDVGQETFTRADAADGRYFAFYSRDISTNEDIDVEYGYVYVSTP